MRQLILRNAETGGAGGPPPAEITSPEPSPGQIVHSPTAAPPPAATTVLEGTKTEHEIKLAAELEETRAALKQRELDVMQWQDENRRLKTVPKPAKAPPVFRLGRFNLE